MGERRLRLEAAAAEVANVGREQALALRERAERQLHRPVAGRPRGSGAAKRTKNATGFGGGGRRFGDRRRLAAGPGSEPAVDSARRVVGARREALRERREAAADRGGHETVAASARQAARWSGGVERHSTAAA